MIKQFRQVKLNNLTYLGYEKAEAIWIKNFAKELSKPKLKNEITIFNNLPLEKQNKILSNVNSDGHSGESYVYTKTIINSILINNYQTWSTNCVHLNYEYIFKYFYSCGFNHLGNKLLTYKFYDPYEYKILLEFRTKQNDKSIKIDQYDLLKLLKIIDKN